MKILIGGPVGVLVVDLRDGFKTSLTGAHVFLAAQTLLQAPPSSDVTLSSGRRT